jgi:pimeloyl-ACP methyl ester carboxylesterase
MNTLTKKPAFYWILAMSLMAFSAESKEKETAQPETKPTIVLVHGAFAESSSWNGVTARLLSRGYPVVAAANPLRSVKGDAAYLDGVVGSIKGPVVLVGHSYGGLVISNADNSGRRIKALVYVAAFAPEVGETAADLSARFPGSSLGSALAPPVALQDGGNDLYIRQDRFHDQFAADIPVADAAAAAVAQRPITDKALNEPSGMPVWTSIPSWSIYGSQDKNIPAAALAFMAQRAQSKRTVAIDGASHVVMMSHPDEVASLIVEAAQSR